MNPTLRLLSVTFDIPIEPWELAAFRGAVSAKAGYERDLFHNHNNDTGGFRYRLPLIQYKQDHGLPMLACLNAGIEELHHFFSQPDWTLQLASTASMSNSSHLASANKPIATTSANGLDCATITTASAPVSTVSWNASISRKKHCTTRWLPCWRGCFAQAEPVKPGFMGFLED